MEPMIYHSSELFHNKRKAPILTQLKWLNKNLPACVFYGVCPHSTCFDWHFVSLSWMRVSILPSYKHPQYFPLKYMYEVQHYVLFLPLTGLLWAIFMCVGVFEWFFWFFFPHSLSSSLRDFELKTKTYTIVSHPQLPSRASICHLLSLQPRQAFTTQGSWDLN